jgi:4-hydroxy-3-polyprenylbenzoate decarboxylase
LLKIVYDGLESYSDSAGSKCEPAFVPSRAPNLSGMAPSPPDYHIRTGLPTSEPALYNIAMSSHGFADFLEQLQADGRLVRVDESVEQRLDIGVKAAEAVPSAALFTNVHEVPIPLILGIFSSPENVLAALQASSFGEAAARVGQLLAHANGETWLERLGGNRTSPLRKCQPKTLRSGPSQQIVHLGRDVDLSGLPVPVFHAEEKYPALTAGRLIGQGPSDDHLHVGRYDFRIIASDRLVACWRPSSAPARLLAHYRRRGESMPVAIAFGGEPVDLLAAMAPLPHGADVLELTGYLRGHPCELIPGRCAGLPVPADAELVIEGVIDPREPFVDPGSGLDAMGQLRRLRPGPVVRVEAVTHRPTPLIPALLPSEKGQIHRTLVRVFLPILRQELPALSDIEFPAFGGDGLWAFASIDKTYAGQTGQFTNAFWGLPKMLHVRYLVIVDDDVDVHNADEVWTAVAAHAAPATDVRLGDVPLDVFLHDPSPGRMAFDATRSLP